MPRSPLAVAFASGLALAAAVCTASAAASAAAPPVTPVSAPALQAASPRSPELRALMDEFLERLVQRSPVGVGGQLNRADVADRLDDPSPAAYAAWRAYEAEVLTRLAAMNRAAFTDKDHLDADLLVYRLKLDLDGARFSPEHMPVNAIDGPQVWLPQLPLFVAFNTAQDYAAYVRRLRALPAHLDAHIEQMRAGIAAGRTQPRFLIRAAIEQARAVGDAQLIENPQAHPMYGPFRDAGRGDAFAADAAAAVREAVVPAFARFADFLENEYTPACRESLAAVDSVDGRDYYDYCLRLHTTLPLSADEVHRIGLDEVARIKAEMMDVIARSDFPQKSLLQGDALFRAFIDDLRTNPRFYFKTEDELLDAYRAFAKKVDPELMRLFGRLPRTPYGIRPIPRFAAKSSPTAYYYPGSVASGRAGYFMANTYALDQRPSFDIVPLTLHEAVPGHHLENALNDELEGVHPLRRLDSYTAYGEGWGLYAERLGLEMGDGERGFYDNAYDDFGRLNYEIWRAIRLVVDTGMHAKGWTRQQALDYMLDNSASTELDAANEVDRYIGWPGQACAYKLGELTIRRLRGEAEQALGDRFDIRAFHDRLLGDGSLPLPVLEAKMRRWIEEQKG